MNKPTMEAIKFVLLWNRAKDRTEVAKKLGVSKFQVSMRAGFLRTNRGVKLKRFQANRGQIDFVAVRRAAKESYPKDD